MNSFEPSTFLLVSASLLFGIASLLALLENHCGSTSARRNSLGRSFLYSTAAIAIIYQFQLLLEASVRIPSGNGKGIYRWECLHSHKGGKRPFENLSDEYRNPCYNHTSEETNVTETETESSSQTLLNTNGYVSSPLCPSSNAIKDASIIESFISDARDCHQSKSSQCSLAEPCVPCELSRRGEFHSSSHGWSRCQACSIRNKFGDCNFIDGVGPYCWENAQSWEVVQCKKCCTESVMMLDEGGICY